MENRNPAWQSPSLNGYPYPMSFQPSQITYPAGAPFLPLAFRFATSFGLFVLHLSLPQEQASSPLHEWLYLAVLALFFIESAWESSRSLAKNSLPFATPTPNWIRFNLVLDILLVTWLIAFQGVDQERFSTIYIFPVLASAFYLGIIEIVAVAVISAASHITTVLLFTSGTLPPFGNSGPDVAATPAHLTFILGFASLQIFASTLVVVLIRRHLEHLRTNLTRSEATVDELSNLYRHVVESMFSGLITSDMEGRITSANPAAATILQRPVSPGLPVEDLGIMDLILVESQPKEQRFEQRFITGSGELRTLGGNVAPLKDGSGKQTGYLVLFQDLTELKALEERTKLQEKLALMGELSSELAHELRNPMASIQGCVQILKTGTPSEPMMDRVLTILKRESERVNALVTGFLDFTKPKSVTPGPMSLVRFIEEVRGAYDMDHRNNGLELRVGEIPDVRIMGESMVGQQIIGNLLSNARKALSRKESPSLKLEATLESGMVVVELRDNGCGMSKEQLQNVFIPFSSGFEEGTGLGMSIVYQFTQRLGWELEIDSEKGVGTCVRLRIPIS